MEETKCYPSPYRIEDSNLKGITDPGKNQSVLVPYCRASED